MYVYTEEPFIRGQTNERVAAFHFLPTSRCIVRADGCSACALVAPPPWAVRRARAKEPLAAALVVVRWLCAREGLVPPVPSMPIIFGSTWLEIGLML